MSFTDPLEVAQLYPGWVTLRAIHFWTDCADAPDVAISVRCATCVVVPAGFQTDFASIPRLFWTVIGHPAGRYAQAAVLHDFLYQSQAFPRRRCDALFLEAMAVLDVPAWQRWLLWAAVRIGGSAAFSAQPEDRP